MLPHAEEAERSILGAILIDPSMVNLAIDLVSPNDFYREANRIIFESILELAAKDVAADTIAVADHLQSRGQLERVGGYAYLGQLAAETATAANIESHCRIVAEKSILRRLLLATERIRKAVREEGSSVQDVLETAEHEIFSVATDRSRKDPVPVREEIRGALTRIVELQKSPTRMTGVPSGYPDLDRLTNGFQPSDLIILAGRPSMGKTSLAVNIIEHIALEEKRPVFFFSLEMPVESVLRRLLASRARVAYEKILSGDLTEDEVSRIVRASTPFCSADIFIDDSSSLTPLELRSRARRLISRVGDPGLIVVDYLQLMHSGRRIDNRVQEVTEISRMLKCVARELRAPVLALSQLSRAPTHRSDRRPQLSDLRDSGAIEQDADLVAFIHREEYYEAGEAERTGEAELLIRKHRNGPTGTVTLVFIGELMRFESAAMDMEPDAETSVYA